jgi:hypothetical protein
VACTSIEQFPRLDDLFLETVVADGGVRCLPIWPGRRLVWNPDAIRTVEGEVNPPARQRTEYPPLLKTQQ